MLRIGLNYYYSPNQTRPEVTESCITTPAMGGGTDQDRHMTDNHLYAALLDTGPDDVFDKDKVYI